MSGCRAQLWWLLAVVGAVYCATDPLYSVSLANPTWKCSAMCMYTINTNRNLVSKCTADQFAPFGTCTACDALLFRQVGTACVPHEYNGEIMVVATSLGFNLGPSALAGNNFDIYNCTVLTDPHYAVRIRFGVQYADNDVPSHHYPLSYSIDNVLYSYTQNLVNYYSSWEIITSPKTTHYWNNATIQFRNLNYSSAAAGKSRMITIRDIIVFSSKCQTGCLNCTSTTFCRTCDFLSGYYLNPADHLCYKVCPQATYKNTTTLFRNAYMNETFCLPCNATCLQCDNLTNCSRCYTLGRNESFLYNNTCVNPCPNLYVGNYTNHTCDCPLDYHFEDKSISVLVCYPCAPECVRCFGLTNLQCTVCEKGFYLANATTYCLNECPAGQYRHNLTRTCHNCTTGCASCEGAPDYCTECLFAAGQTRYLLGHECLTWCPGGYAWNNVSRTCDLCTLYSYSYQGKCVAACPSFHLATLSNRSCTHYSLTNMRFNLTLLRINVLPHGKLLRFTLLAQDGLDAASWQWVARSSYSGARVVSREATGVRVAPLRSLLGETYLTVRNVQIQGNYILLYTGLPGDLELGRSYSVQFAETLFSGQGVGYANESSPVSVGQRPETLREYYLYAVHNNYNAIMIPWVVGVLLLLALRMRGVYSLLVELMRVAQLVGLLVYAAFPLGPLAYYFLVGCSYANFDFLPNLYALFAPPHPQTAFSSFLLAADDMDFLRLNGSIFTFALVWLALYSLFRWLIKAAPSALSYLLRLGCDLIEVKVMHSAWSAFLSVVANLYAADLPIFVSLGIGCVCLGALTLRRIVDEGELGPFWWWRLTATLLLVVVPLGNELTLSVLLACGVGVGIWQLLRLHSLRREGSTLSLNSDNYMDERTFEVISGHDQQVQYALSISIRNSLMALFPTAAAILAAVPVLLRDADYSTAVFDACVLYVLLGVVGVTMVLVYKFLEERRKYLVQNKLEYLQRKYAKVTTEDSQLVEARQRPRLPSHLNFHDEKFLETAANRTMMKSFD